MAYVQPSGGEPIDADVLQSLASLIGLSIPPEDLETLATALRDQLASIAQLETLDLSGVTPSSPFDPRWHD